LFVAKYGNEVRDKLPMGLEAKAKDIFKGIEEHLLLVSNAAASLLEAQTSPGFVRIAAPKLSEVTSSNWTERKALPRCKSVVRFVVVASALSIAPGLGWLGGLTLYDRMIQSDELSGRAAVSALVERIISVESNGDPSVKNGRSSAMGPGQFLDETWLDLIRAYRPDLITSHTTSETLDLRREPKLTREIMMRLVERNVALLRKRRLPVTAGTVYLAHFAGPAGVVAILSAPDNLDAALVIANADSTGRTKRERLVKANPFLEHFTAADLKDWAERKMHGPYLHLVEGLDADRRP
jgi:hypothetical protein